MSLIALILVELARGALNVVLLPWHIWHWWHLETLKERMSALTLAGMSSEFLFMVLALLLALLILCVVSLRANLALVLGLEGFNRRIGQLASWFVLLMMLQQVLIIIMGQVFRGNELLFSPLGITLSSAQLQWFSGQLKFYNAILIAMASAYTFIEGGHVRVDLVYGNLSYRAQRWIDLLGSLLFMLPVTILLWWFSWPLVMNALFSQRPMNIFSDKASWRGVKLETSGTAEFTWVWAFKVLILVFAALLFLQAVAFCFRNLLALRTPDESIQPHPRMDEPDTDLTPDSDLGAGQVPDVSVGPGAPAGMTPLSPR